MSVDEALLLSAAERNEPTLRFYQWSQPTISLGYFQGYAERESHAASQASPIVRRASGGGAILHDAELTYSIALPPESPLASEPQSLYDAVHLALVDVLAEQGIAAELRPPVERIPRSEEPLLCFQRAAAGDVLVNGIKIAGSAQRRTRHGVLQHGSLLLARSPLAPELPGLAELTGAQLSAAALPPLWSAALAKRVRLTFSPESITEEESRAAEQIALTRYHSDSWTRRR